MVAELTAAGTPRASAMLVLGSCFHHHLTQLQIIYPHSALFSILPGTPLFTGPPISLLVWALEQDKNFLLNG